MAVYSVEGKLGTGKTKFCIWRAQQALRRGLRVASNVDINLKHLVPELRYASYLRIPDKPTSFDLDSIGHGNPDSYDEDRNGVLILDELGSWLNSRAFQDKDRHAVIEWLIHARKLGWDVYLIVQDSMMIDRQVRDALIEYQCKCLRMDKVKVPMIGGILGLFNKRLAYMPKFHLVTARLGSGATSIVAERWQFRGVDLHAAYNTRQIFSAKPGDCTRTVLHEDRFLPVETVIVYSWWRALLNPERPRPKARPRKPESPVLQLLRSLPPDERIRHFQRFQLLGAI
jgi:hypothetical protein